MYWKLNYQTMLRNLVCNCHDNVWYHNTGLITLGCNSPWPDITFNPHQHQQENEATFCTHEKYILMMSTVCENKSNHQQKNISQWNKWI